MLTAKAPRRRDRQNLAPSSGYPDLNVPVDVSPFTDMSTEQYAVEDDESPIEEGEPADYGDPVLLVSNGVESKNTAILLAKLETWGLDVGIERSTSHQRTYTIDWPDGGLDNE